MMYCSSKHLCPLHRDQLDVLGIFWAKGLDSIAGPDSLATPGPSLSYLPILPLETSGSTNACGKSGSDCEGSWRGFLLSGVGTGLVEPKIGWSW